MLQMIKMAENSQKIKLLVNATDRLVLLILFFKGKKNDYVAHYASLYYILSWHKNINEIDFNAIKCMNMHTDNCPVQCKC